jgi:hypothetical protein
MSTPIGANDADQMVWRRQMQLLYFRHRSDRCCCDEPVRGSKTAGNLRNGKSAHCKVVQFAFLLNLV